MLFLVVGVVFLCWFFCIGWLGLVLVISCLGKGTVMNGIREFRRQVTKERFGKQRKGSMPGEDTAWLWDFKSRRMVDEIWDDLH